MLKIIQKVQRLETVPGFFELFGSQGGLRKQIVVKLLIMGLEMQILLVLLWLVVLLDSYLFLFFFLELLGLHQAQLFVAHCLEMLVVLYELSLFLFVNYSQRVEVLLRIHFVQ